MDIGRPLNEWNKKYGSKPPPPPEVSRVISFLPKPETRGFNIDEDLEEIDEIVESMKTCETESERTQLKAWKRWDVMMEHAQDAMQARVHRAKFFHHLNELTDSEIERIVHNDEPYAVNTDAIVRVSEDIESWYHKEYNEVTGTTRSLSGCVDSGDDSFNDLSEEEKSVGKEVLCVWVLRGRLLFLSRHDYWMSCDTRGKDIKDLHNMFQYGVEGGCLVDESAPILGYDMRTLVMAGDSLYRCWTELPFSKGVVEYIDLLRVRCATISSVMFPIGSDTLNRPDMCSVCGECEHTNMTFIEWSLSTLGNVDRCMVAFKTLLTRMGRIAPTPWPYGRPFGMVERQEGHSEEEETAKSSMLLFKCFRDWISDFCNTTRADSIRKKFNKHIVEEFVRPGEYSVYRKKYPMGDPNATNIVSKLRPNDIDRMRSQITGSKLQTIMSNDTDAVGFVTARNEIAIAALEYFCAENVSLDFVWNGGWLVRKALAKWTYLKRSSSVFPKIIQTVGGFLVWCPWVATLKGKWDFFDEILSSSRERRGESGYKIGLHIRQLMSKVPKNRVRKILGCNQTCIFSALHLHEALHLACVLNVKHNREIAAALVMKSTSYDGEVRLRKPIRVLLEEVTKVYLQARTVLVKIFGGCNLEPKVWNAVMCDGVVATTTRPIRKYVRARFDHEKFSGQYDHVVRRERKAFEEEEEERMKAYFERARRLKVPSVVEWSALFPDMDVRSTRKALPVSTNKRSKTIVPVKLIREKEVEE
jgi:hypothetical protein